MKVTASTSARVVEMCWQRAPAARLVELAPGGRSMLVRAVGSVCPVLHSAAGFAERDAELVLLVFFSACMHPDPLNLRPCAVRCYIFCLAPLAIALESDEGDSAAAAPPRLIS